MSPSSLASGSRTTDDPPSEGEVVSHRIFLHKNTANEIEEISVSLHGCRDFVSNFCCFPRPLLCIKFHPMARLHGGSTQIGIFGWSPLPSSKQQIDSLDQLNPKPKPHSKTVENKKIGIHTVELHMMQNLRACQFVIPNSNSSCTWIQQRILSWSNLRRMIISL